MRTISLTALRRLTIAAQGYATRSRAGTAREVDATIRRLSCVQLDSISAVERSHRIALSSRVGAYRAGTVPRLLAEGRVFEYWAHEACLLPVEEWPLFVSQMKEGGRKWYGDVGETHPHLAEEIMAEIRERGPLGSRHFEGSNPEGGGMWNWKPAKAMLDLLWNHGDLVIAGRQSFQRLYDLPERVIPKAVLDAPVPAEPERLRALATKAVVARGALTEAGIVEHWRLRGGVARIRPVIDGLVDDGIVERVTVEDGGAPVVVSGGVDLEPSRPTAAALLSPFDNLLWDRVEARVLHGFDHALEIYKRPAERVYGYYVLPLVDGSKVVGRIDAKADRAASVLRALAVHWEGRPRPRALREALGRLAFTLGLEDTEVPGGV
jgi:uncharacterized protein YcaQ